MGMLGITGVESVDSSSRQKAMKNRIDRGVAGRSMATVESAQKAYEDPARQRPARERVRVVLGDGDGVQARL